MIGVTAIIAMASGSSSIALADQLRLVDRAEGNTVEVLEERPDAFVVKIPKSDVALLKRETPTEIKLWKEKKILWEDQGDYLVISLPKERIAPPPAMAADAAVGYETTATLAAGLTATGARGQASALGVLSGHVAGRVLHQGHPLTGCRVKLNPIRGPALELTRLLATQTTQGPSPIETTTKSDGAYLFEDVPIGEYDISWLPPDSTHWLGWLSDQPDVTVRAGEIAQQGDIEL